MKTKVNTILITGGTSGIAGGLALHLHEAGNEVIVAGHARSFWTKSHAVIHVSINLLGTIRMTYAFPPRLVGNDSAVIMNVTSAMAFVPRLFTPTYSATKAALHSFSKACVFNRLAPMPVSR